MNNNFIEYGFNDYIAKPVNSDIIMKTILEWVNVK